MLCFSIFSTTLFCNVRVPDRNQIHLHERIFIKDAICFAGGLLEFDNEKRGGDAAVSRIKLPEVTQEGQWCHLALLFHRAGIYKNSTVSLYANKEHVKTEKVLTKPSVLVFKSILSCCGHM